MKLIYISTIFLLIWAPANLLDPNNNQFEGDQNNQVSSWPFAVSNGPSNNNHLKSGLVRTPCRRRNNDPQSTYMNIEQWIPSFRSKIVKPNVNEGLKSESLRSYNNYPKLNAISESKSNENASDNEQPAMPIICYQISLENEFKNGPVTKMSTETTEHLNTESPDNTKLFRRRMQNTNLDSVDVVLDPNIKTGLFKLCSEPETISDQVLKLDDKNRRNLNNEIKNHENKAYYTEEDKSRNRNEQRTGYKSDSRTFSNADINTNSKQTNIVQVPSFDPLPNSNFMSDEESNNYNENLRDMKFRFSEPTKGEGIKDLSQSRVMLMENSRVCYACNSASDPTCWEPSRRTTVKYCRKEHDVCVTKTYRNRRSTTIIRDCAKSCDETSLSILEPKFTSCSVCHSDLCNGAYSTTNRHTIIMGLISYMIYIFQSDLS